MSISDIKYLAAYLLPLCGVVAITGQGVWTYSALIFAFVVIPLVEAVVPRSTENLLPDQAQSKAASSFFDFLLYFNIVVVYGLMTGLLIRVTTTSTTTGEFIGLVGSVGTVMGACGINVAHELGHKRGRLPQLAARLLLLPCLYMHFVIEHNRGHHIHVGTPADPATSRRGEIVYMFWLRSVWGGYRNAWQLEATRLTAGGYPIISIRNEMIRIHVTQGIYLLIVGVFFGLKGLIVAVAVAIISFLLLETINYIEHYGLQRRKLQNGKYEPVEVVHSWNSNHEFGRLVLYELTRHSDHHYRAYKKYQVLDHHDESPQLPLGYPGSMLLSFVPPLWFRMMDTIVEQHTCRS